MTEEALGPTRTTEVVVRELRKRYGDTVALDGLDLTARAGEILGVAGPNGAGKSTLVKILAGEVAADSGTVQIGGQEVSSDLAAHEVAIVHQEPTLFPNLTVAENLLVGREPGRFLQRGIGPAEQRVLESLSIDHLAGALLGEVPLAVQQRTEIARALVRDRSVFLFDEPNSALTEEESDDLFERMHGLAEDGHVVILVSHRLAELAEHTDRVLMVVDGRVTAELVDEQKSKERIARELVVGHDAVGGTAGAVGRGTGGALLRVRGWTHGNDRFREIDMTVPGKSVVAIVGVEGSGAREFVRSLVGLEPAHGEISLEDDGRGRAVFERTSFVGADRADSLFTNLTVGENIAVRLHSQIRGRMGWLDEGELRDVAQAARRRFSVKAASLDQPVRDLSGGNQQKVAIAAALVTDPRVVVLEEPTRGIDVGSKAEIYDHLRRYAADGDTVIMFCTEDSEVFEAADVVHVVARGQLSPPLDVATYETVEELAADLSRIEDTIDPRMHDTPASSDQFEQGRAEP